MSNAEASDRAGEQDGRLFSQCHGANSSAFVVLQRPAAWLHKSAPAAIPAPLLKILCQFFFVPTGTISF
jgi:hypothetical protein